jgi:hypothetical protein
MKEASRDRKYNSKTTSDVNSHWESCNDLIDFADFVGTANVQESLDFLHSRHFQIVVCQQEADENVN